MPVTDFKAVISGDYLELYKYTNRIMYGTQPPLFKRSRKRKTARVGCLTQTNIHRTRSSLRRILQANAYQYFKIDGKPFLPIFITYTFKENVKELDVANRFFKIFIQRLNYFVFQKKCADLKYLVVPEFQKRGAVHYHCIFFNLPFIEQIYDEMQRIWGQGFCIVKTINDCRHLVNYISKYFTKEAMDDRLIGRKKYFCSRDLKPVIVERDENLKEKFFTMSDSLKKEIEFSYMQEFTNNEIFYSRYSGLKMYAVSH